MSAKDNQKPTLTLKLAEVKDSALLEELKAFDTELTNNSQSIQNLNFTDHVNDEKVRSFKKRLYKGLKDFETNVEKNTKLSKIDKLENMMGYIEGLVKNNGKNIPELVTQIGCYNEIKKSTNTISAANTKESDGVAILEKLKDDATAKKDAVLADWKKKTEDEKQETEKMKEELEENLKNLHQDLNTKIRRMDILEKENENLITHLEKIEEDINKQGLLYEEDYTKRKGDVDEYTGKMDKHVDEMGVELKKLDEYKIDEVTKKELYEEKDGHQVDLTKRHDVVQAKMTTFDDFFKSTKKTMEKLRIKINQIDTDANNYENKHDSRCDSMISVIQKNADLRKLMAVEDKKISGMKTMLLNVEQKIKDFVPDKKE